MINSNKILIKACVLVKNEEKDLPKCLDAICNQFEDVIVIDSGSTDSSLEIAKHYKCEIIKRSFVSKFGIGEQRNWVLSNQQSKCEYIFL